MSAILVELGQPENKFIYPKTPTKSKNKTNPVR